MRSYWVWTLSDNYHWAIGGRDHVGLWNERRRLVCESLEVGGLLVCSQGESGGCQCCQADNNALEGKHVGKDLGW